MKKTSNKTSLNTRKIWIIVLCCIAFIMIVSLFSNSVTKIDNSEEINNLKEEISIRTKIMEIDNNAFTRSADMGTYCANGINAAFMKDIAGMESTSNDMKKLTDDILVMVNEKNFLLEKLDKLIK